MTAQRDICNVD